MKKYVFLFLAAAVVMILSVSCIKTTTNSNKILGQWKVTKMEWVYKEITQPEPFDANVQVALEFQTDGTVYHIVKEGDDGVMTEGSWSIDGDNLTVRFSEDTINFFSGSYVISKMESKYMTLAINYKGIGLLGIILKK